MIILVLFAIGCSSGCSSEDNNIEYSPAEIFEIASKSVVEITTKDIDNNYLSVGSGFVYREDGIILTNYHVIEGAASATIKLNALEYAVNSVCAYDINKDIAFLKINASGLQALKLSDRELTVGDTVYSLGSSRGLTLTFADGIITSTNRNIKDVNYVQHNADISSGNSGGPLLNKYCEVIGINTMTIKESQNLNFAISNGEILSVSFKTELTLYQVYKNECDGYEKLKDLIISKDSDGAPDSDGNYYAFLKNITLSSGSAWVYAEYDNLNSQIRVGIIFTNGFLFEMYIKEISTTYEYVLFYSTSSRFLKGKIYASIFTKDVVKLSYTSTNVSGTSNISSYRELGAACMHVILSTLDTEIKDANIGDGVSMLGFTSYV